ncbi:hypothetical protein EDD85DRAFT_789584 [Armillaria nabsnona]|nr:hypothetical protein EDD85DRAFT_789584 [Armillaria nabsnona]
MAAHHYGAGFLVFLLLSVEAKNYHRKQLKSTSGITSVRTSGAVSKTLKPGSEMYVALKDELIRDTSSKQERHAPRVIDPIDPVTHLMGRMKITVLTILHVSLFTYASDDVIPIVQTVKVLLDAEWSHKGSRDAISGPFTVGTMDFKPRIERYNTGDIRTASWEPVQAMIRDMTFLKEQGIQFPFAFFSPAPVVPALSFRQRGQQEGSTIMAV